MAQLVHENVITISSSMSSLLTQNVMDFNPCYVIFHPHENYYLTYTLIIDSQLKTGYRIEKMILYLLLLLTTSYFVYVSTQDYDIRDNRTTSFTTVNPPYTRTTGQNEWTNGTSGTFGASTRRESVASSTPKTGPFTSETQAYQSTWPSTQSTTNDPYQTRTSTVTTRFPATSENQFTNPTRSPPSPTSSPLTTTEEWTRFSSPVTTFTTTQVMSSTPSRTSSPWATSTTRTPSTTTVPVTFSTANSPFEPSEGSRGSSSQGDDGTIMYDSLEHWLNDFHFKLSEQRNQIYHMRIDSDSDTNRYRSKSRADSFLRTLSINQESVRRFVLARQDYQSINALKRQESRFCQYGYTYWPLSTRTVKCGTGYVSGNCCVMDKSCLYTSLDPVHPRLLYDNRTAQVSFPDTEY